MRRVKILDKAAEEAIEAAAWYQQERPGLGIEFAHAVNVAIDLLEDEIIPLTKMSELIALLCVFAVKCVHMVDIIHSRCNYANEY